MSLRVPPEGQAMEFIENTGTGTVHILPWNDSGPTPVPPGGWGDAIAVLLTAPPPQMLCGFRLRHTWPGGTRPASFLVPG
jgi:hypothetical protein